jgi:hypothetical protein
VTLQCFFEVVYGFNYVPCKFENGRLKKSEIWFFINFFIQSEKL